ncbi:Endo-1,4-beta-xylanase Z precursor [Planctomycetes bacterium Pan216]|uniref:Endo-1,4-beta-xylanase Z n=1 Tax=Kolteria novifilia TaxID=2527975 RepID=A0A518AYN6_9BACT|nr:Endo-1,4-beta-xylanase Z precursor [Planctomycetes bacterium Pan216]
MSFSLVLSLLALVPLADDESPMPKKSKAPQKETRLKTKVPVEMGYLLYLPEDYTKKKSWPLLLFLHGMGERGDDLELVKKHGPPKLVEAGKEFPFIVVSPQCPDTQWWEPIELMALLDEIEKKYSVDKDRIYVTGLSMGGFGTWRLAAYAPNRFAAIAPVCGGGEAYWGKLINHLPVWAFHGAKDKAVPLERSEAMVNAIEKNKGEPKLTVYPEAGHDSWTETYDNPELYEWLLKHERQEPKPKEKKKARSKRKAAKAA